MTYWHMQLHPDDKNWGKEKELLNDLSLIGIGNDWKSGESQINNFKKDMKVNDIVLIRSGETPIALVEVVGELEDILDNDFTRLDWFRYRRKVNVLDFANDKQQPFPQPRGTLQKLINKTTDSYRYIESWYQKISPSFYKKQDGLKIENLYIQKFKIFNEFNLKFATPITIIAGINGSGKTTILEYIKNFTNFISDKDNDRSIINVKIFNKNYKKYKGETLRYSNSQSLEAKYFNDHIYYFSTGTSISDLKIFIAKYTKKVIYEEDLKPSEVFDKIRESIDRIFQDLDILITFEKVDKQDNVYFRNKKGEIFTIDELSTGEKTLLSKVLYLYLKDIKDSVILIDEPELSLHPAWQNRVLKLYENFAKENNCQIIIATHSPHIIGSAKNEYIRILTEDGVINDVTAYGRDIEWVLEEVMGANYTREKSILDKFDEIQELINDSKLNEAEEKLNALENIIGSHDKEILKLRNDLAFQRIDFEEDN